MSSLILAAALFMLKLDPLHFYKALADETRLQSLLLIQQEGELCVCELTTALGLSQPKISRHLGQLRACGLLQDRRDGIWVHYRLNPKLPEWAGKVLNTTQAANPQCIKTAQQRLRRMRDRPARASVCC
jgi:ArsR family transcriptional regulator, arsenate/arsenite/antimonite-responsive transcriptional repressor